jgi:hypothetical protein
LFSTLETVAIEKPDSLAISFNLAGIESPCKTMKNRKKKTDIAFSVIVNDYYVNVDWQTDCPLVIGSEQL